MKSKPLAIDLYCGLGGWAEGLLSECYDVIGFDIERHDYDKGRSIYGDNMKESKFNVGEVVVIKSMAKLPVFRILHKIYDENSDSWSYAWDKRNYAHEGMLRKLTDEEKGL
jgi:site-specific DNA-cytosine methylase